VAEASKAKKAKVPPRYQTIADELRAEILAGSFKHGDQLKTEPELMDQYGVSRPTAHRALIELEAEGLVEIRHGIGTFVRAWPPILRNIGKRMAADVWGSGSSVWDAETEGRTYGVDSQRIYRGEAPARIAQQLGESDVWIRERRHIVDDRPVMLSRSYYPTQIVAGSPITEPMTGDGGAPARLAELGYAPHHHSKRFRGRQPTPDERKRLELPPGSVIVAFLRTSFDKDGRPVEVTEMVAAGDAYVFQIDFAS
jgi:GntR family transcriptional regulator